MLYSVSYLWVLTSSSSYKSLAPKTRGMIGVALMLNASAMLLFSDQIEAALGLTPTQQEQQTAFKVYTLDREKKG
jgi:hypothetical protein